MVEVTLEVINKTGLHARPASQFVQKAQQFVSEIKVKKDQSAANAKSIMEIMSLGAGKGDTISIVASGDDEEMAIDALGELIKSGFGEE